MPSPGDAVIGVVYRWSKAAREKMGGEYEKGYVQQVVEVTTDLDQALSAVTFVADADNLCGEGQPPVKYLQKIISGARQHDLPQEYIRQIQSLAGCMEEV
jgi:cation transport regulator ChaC